MKSAPDLPGRAPDVFFIKNDHLDRVRRLNLEGPADLVIEVISTGSEETDRGDKFYEYQQAGVPEYWLIDPDREVAEFYLLDDRGVFRSANVPQDGVFESRAIEGLRIRVEWLWQRPPVSDLLEELGLR
jgi:Uma2 family endonuclease